MEMFNMQINNPKPVLAGLLETLQNFDASGTGYFRRLKSDEPKQTVHSFSRPNMFGIYEQVLPEFLQLLGIRCLILNESFDLGPLFDLSFTADELKSGEDLWFRLKEEKVVKHLQQLFLNCSAVAFEDWANMAGASNFWNGLLSEVIKPLKRNDLEFIFYFGDSREKPSFHVNLALDIIGSFSTHGNVTLALEEDEANVLWMILNGLRADAYSPEQSLGSLRKRLFTIFRMTNVTRLLIYSPNTATLFSNEQQFAISRKSVSQNIEFSKDARQNFVEGFSVGLLLGLDTAHCIALGLSVFGAYGEHKNGAGTDALTTYIQQWISDLDQYGEIYLYQ